MWRSGIATRSRSSKIVWMFVALLCALGALSFKAQAQTPRAGSTISNTASATYTDGSGVARSAQSNAVTTTVQQVAAVDLVDNRNADGVAGEVQSFPHTVTNNGNASETQGTLSTTDNRPGFTSTIFFDANGNGTFEDGVDPAATNLSQISIGTGAVLDAGETATLFVRVTAPLGAVAGVQDATVVSVAATGGVRAAPTDSATDISTVVAGHLTLVKEQALDANNDGEPDAAYTQGNITTGAIPGAGLRYRITVTNTGASNALNVIVTDPTPAFTTYSIGDGNDGADGVPDNAVYFDGSVYRPATSAPTPGATGTVTWNIGTLAPNQAVTVFFGVRIRQ